MLSGSGNGRMRTAGVWIAAAVVLAALASGCGGSDDSGKKSGTTVDTAYGKVTVPSRPKRVVVLSLDYLETSLALGIKPVGAPTGVPLGPWVTQRINTKDDKVFAFANPAGGNLAMEKIAALHPDLIVGSVYAITKARFEKLSKLAPTIAHDDDAGSTKSGAWEDITRQLGTATGREDRAEEVISDAHEKLAAARKAVPASQGKSVVFAGVNSQGLSLTIGKERSGMRLLEALGLEPTDAGVKGKAYGGGRVMLSLEKIDTLDQADLLIIAPIDAKGLTELTSSAVYKSLDIVKKKRVLQLDLQGAYAFNTPTALNIDYILETLEPLLASAGPS